MKEDLIKIMKEDNFLSKIRGKTTDKICYEFRRLFKGRFKSLQYLPTLNLIEVFIRWPENLKVFKITLGNGEIFIEEFMETIK